MSSNPTSKKRAARQEARRKYAQARENAQIIGVLPTTPEGALKPEQVDPATQSEQAQPALIGEAIRRGWAVPEEKKPGLVDELTGIVENPEAQPKVKVAAFNALRMADKDQYERDHPKQAEQSGATILNVNVVEVPVSGDGVEQDAQGITETEPVSPIEGTP